ncbi:CPBP family intramembrane metalloprotease [bacterium]|nr:CPBP family intramembrane metalloprotease [bacterium]
MTRAIKIYTILIIVLAVSAAIGFLLMKGSFSNLVPETDLAVPDWLLALANAGIMLVLYGGLGLLGLFLARKLGFADIWDEKVTNKRRFLIPAIVGIIIGIIFIAVDLVVSRYHSLGQLPHPQFPASIFASIVAGIGEEIIFRLFFISFWVWLISYVILRKRGQDTMFWIVTFFSALVFAIGHIPSVMLLYGLDTVGEIPVPLMIEIILLNGILSFFCADYFRKYGFLAAVSIHFWADVVWHIIWGAIN